VALHPARGTTLRGIYSEAFRAPTWAETDLANYRVVPSGNLSPETVRSVEGGIEHRFSAQRVQFGVFRSWWSDLIADEKVPLDVLTELQRQGRVPFATFDMSQYRNVARIDNYGWTGGWEGSVGQGRFRYGANATGAYTRREVNGTSSPLAIAPRTFGNLRIAYTFGGLLPTPALAVSYMGPRLSDRPKSDGEAPQMAELRFTLTGVVPLAPGLSYRLSAAYVTASEGPYAAGPNFGTIVASPGADFPPLGFVPLDRFRVFVGLRYDFAGGAQATKVGD
jgi:outer membrane receptor for ferrienterochelin and colicin